MQERELRSRRGGIVYDADLLRKSACEPDDALFDLDRWRRAGALSVVTAGRGSVAFIRRAHGAWVLRHYRRGGLVGRCVEDTYVWSGAADTRSFREWRLLAQLRVWNLPVPAPVAARYERSGLLYRADLMTVAIPDTTSLAQQIRSARAAIPWHGVGAALARFHARGVQHADLNAHNVLIDVAGAVFLLDFDRGRIRPRGPWEERVLTRLRRSLEKVTAEHGGFAEREWQQLMAGYCG